MDIADFKTFANSYTSLEDGIVLVNGKGLAAVKQGRPFTKLQQKKDANSNLRTQLFNALTQELDKADAGNYINRLREELLGDEQKGQVLTVKELRNRLITHEKAVDSLRIFKDALVVDSKGPVDTDLGGLDAAAARRATGIITAGGIDQLVHEGGMGYSEDRAKTLEENLRVVYSLTFQNIKDACDDATAKPEFINLINKTIEALMDLGETVREHLNRSDEQSEGLLKLMDYCHARASEIRQVVNEAMTAIEEKKEYRGKDKTIAVLMAEASLEMHGADAFRTAVGTKVTALTDRLNALKQDKSSVCQWNAFNDLKNELKTLENTLEKAGMYGIDLANDRTKGVFVPERSLVDAYLQEVTRAINDVDELLNTDYKKLARNLIDDCFSQEHLCKLGIYAGEAKKVRDALMKKLEDSDSKDLEMLTDEDFQSVKLGLSKGSVVENDVELLVRQLRMMKEVANGKRRIPAALMAKFLDGRIGVGTLVGAIANGFGPEQVDDRLDDRFITGNEPLGEGGISTVRLLTYTFPDGTTEQRVFKPETNARMGMNLILSGQTGYDDTTRVAHLNSATAKSADLLGVRHLADDVTIGMHDGHVGFFMRVAPGSDMKTLTLLKGEERALLNNTNPPVPMPKVPMPKYAKLGFLSGTFLNDETPHDDIYMKMAGVQKDLCELEWLDCLTGQMDRHDGNYLVETSFKGPHSVKAVDSDMSFADYRVGMFKFRLTGLRLDQALKSLQTTKPTFLKKYKNRISYDSKNNIIIDIENDPILLRDIGYYVFGANSLVRPRCITKSLYLKLMEMDKASQKDPKFLKTTVRNLFAQGAANDLQLEATMARLSEMIEHAKNLMKEDEEVRKENKNRAADDQLGNRVVDDKDWNDPVQAKALLLDQIAAWTLMKNTYQAEFLKVYGVKAYNFSLKNCNWLGLGYVSRHVAVKMPSSIAELGNNLGKNLVNNLK